jgi:hypothetical protein
MVKIAAAGGSGGMIASTLNLQKLRIDLITTLQNLPGKSSTLWYLPRSMKSPFYPEM